MRTTTTVTVHDEATRRVITFALWRVVSADVVGSSELSDGFYDRAWRAIHPVYMPGGETGEVEHRLVRLTSVRASARAVAAAAEGERLRLPVSPLELEEALMDLLVAMEQHQDLLERLSDDDREEVLGSRLAATQLLEDLADAAPVPTAENDDFIDAARLDRLDHLEAETLRQPLPAARLPHPLPAA